MGTDRSKELELGNRQEHSVHLRLIRQDKDFWDQTGAKCSLELHKTGERYLGSDRSKVFT